MDAKLIVDIPAINWACTYPLDPEKVNSAGRGKHNAVEIPDMGTSDRHVEFYFSRGNWYVRDVGGEGGLRVNGRILQESVISPGDDIRIGNSQLTFEVAEDPDDEDWKQASEAIRSESQRAQQSDEAAPGLDQPVLSGDTPIPAASTPSAPAKPKILAPLYNSAQQQQSTDEETDDLLWVSRKISQMLEDVLSRPASLEFVLKRMLMKAREAIGADYGFLMVPDQKSGRWLIRTQVGDAFSWSGYERAHPVPLSAATSAFKRRCTVSNAMADDESIEDIGPSASMIALRVNGYVAVPLLKGDVCRGVLYFDTRDNSKEFRTRDVKLLKQAGAMVIEIEDRRRGSLSPA